MHRSYRVAIVGAGPVGLACAVMLKSELDALEIKLFDQSSRKQIEKDQRTIVLSHASRLLLERYGAWHDATHALENIEVSQQGGVSALSRLSLRSDMHDLPAFGYSMSYPDLWLGLVQRCEALQMSVQSNVKVQAVFPVAEGMGVEWVVVKSEHANAHIYQQPQMHNKAVVEPFDLVIHAEGGLFAQQEKREFYHDYQQSACIMHVCVANPMLNSAFERFTKLGVLALIPVQHNQWHYALVYCLDQHQAELFTNNHQSFNEACADALPYELRGITQNSVPFMIKLGLNARLRLSKNCMVYIGNAAQTLHPIASQGLNLGLRDAFELSDLLRSHVDQPLAATLQKYSCMRAKDRLAMMLATHAFARPTPAWMRSGLMLGLQSSMLMQRKLVNTLLYGLS